MLQLKNITKRYKAGTVSQTALDGISLNLRKSEFVSVLGPSGSGKTTLLNIIGGLDRYDTGDLIVGSTSTRRFSDRDWDAYRSHTVGFVFQSYNLIPHQSILANVELALTISGVSRSRRRRRARQALEEVGLGDQLTKRPSQLSGGQMQRVAIARALVNDPDILLADEPTGALDAKTSIQIMELLKAVAETRLVVMVTHNRELAERYSTRIVRLSDGKIISDSDPMDAGQSEEVRHAKEALNKSARADSARFWLTGKYGKRGNTLCISRFSYCTGGAKDPLLRRRRFIQRFPGPGRAKMDFLTSLSLSFQNLRTKKGRTLLTAFAGSIGIIGIALILALSAAVNRYITDVQKNTMSAYPITIRAADLDFHSLMQGMGSQHSGEGSGEPDGILSDTGSLEQDQLALQSIKSNNLTAFKQYLDDPGSEIAAFIGETGVVYTYDLSFHVLSFDPEGNLVNSNTLPGETEASGGILLGSGTNHNFSEMPSGSGGLPISRLILDSYDVLYGTWPREYNEVVLVVGEGNRLDLGLMYQLGLVTAEAYKSIAKQIEQGETPAPLRFDYGTVCGQPLYLIAECDRYLRNDDGIFYPMTGTAGQQKQLLDAAVRLKISGVVRLKESAGNAFLSTPLAYTSRLTDYLITRGNESAVIRAQESNPEFNVLTGIPFAAETPAQCANHAASYLSRLGITEKSMLYGALFQDQAAGMTEQEAADSLDAWLAGSPDESILLELYRQYIPRSTYADNLRILGKVSYDTPDSISIYVDRFEDKDGIAQAIRHYNETAGEDAKITYTDYVALLTSSVTSMISAISYVLMGFVAVSLMVSCIMIGIITHISVLERTKEIGILRAMGASKGNISQVFNAETVIIGLLSGILGVGISWALTFPINSVIAAVLDTVNIRVRLPLNSVMILVCVSVAVTLIGGMIPAIRAAKKDPVIALRSE